MSKRERLSLRSRSAHPHGTLPEAHETRSHFYEYVSHRAPGLMASPRAPVEVRSLARSILARSHGVVVSSSMALSSAITAMRANADYGRDSMELSLMQAVLRYSEQHQVPPKVVMQLIAEDEEAQAAPLGERKPD